MPLLVGLPFLIWMVYLTKKKEKENCVIEKYFSFLKGFLIFNFRKLYEKDSKSMILV